MVEYERIVLGDLETNCYLVWDDRSKEAIIIDPADDGVGISEEIERIHLIPVGIAATHGHFDHLLGGLDLKLIYNIPFYCSSKDMFLLERQASTAKHFLKKNIVVPNFMKIDMDLDEISQIDLGDSYLKVLKTPGHTPGGISLFAVDEKIIFCGDTLMAQAKGDTNHQYSDTKELYKSIKKILEVGDDVTILPGHGEATTAETEKRFYI